MSEKKEKSIIKDLGYSFPQTEMVRLDLPNIRGQRTPVKSDIEKYIGLAGGFDARMYRKPYVARTTADEGRKWLESLPVGKDRDQYNTGFLNTDGVEDGYFRILFDGGHRRQLYTLLLESRGEPVEKATWQCDVYAVDNVQTAHEQFVKIQSELQKSLHTDLLFIHKCYAGVLKDSKEERVINALEKAGLVVSYEEDVIGEKFASDLTRPSISVNGFKTIISNFNGKNFTYVIDAVKILKSAFAGLQGTQARMKLNQYLVYGVAQTLQTIDGQITETDRFNLVLDAVKDWTTSTSTKFNSALASEQKDHLQKAHAQVWGTDKLNMSPYSAGVAVTGIVERFNDANDFFPSLEIDTKTIVANTMSEEKKQKNKKAANLLKVA